MNENVKKDPVNHPSHYISKSGLETIDVLRSFTEGLNGIEAVCTGNALKYLCRWKHKNGVEDLKKAVWYINYLIDILEGGKEKVIPDSLQREIDGFINKMSNPTGVKYVVKVPEVWFISKKEAVRYICSLHDILNEKGYVTVRDVKERAGIVPEADDIRFGWTKVQTLTDNPDLGGEFKWRVTIVGRPVEIERELTDVVLEKQHEEKPRINKMSNPTDVKYVVKVPEPWFTSKKEADGYIQSLHDILDEKGYVTVRDVKGRAGIVPDTDDIKFGWTKVHTLTDNPGVGGDFTWRVTIVGRPVEIERELTDVVLEKQHEEKPRKWKDLGEEEAKRTYGEWFKEYSKRIKKDAEDMLAKSACLCHVPTFVFDSKNKAKKYIRSLRELRNLKGYVTVRDAKEGAGLSQEAEDVLYGWRSFDTHLDGPYIDTDSKWRVDILGPMVELKEDEV